MNRRLRVALITNRFPPQVGGAEINIDHQARHLARHVDLKVFCPKRVDGPSREERDGFRIERLDDVLNRTKSYPNNKSDTFCPSIFFKILFGRFDLVHCFPALNRNNMLAALAARLTGKKIVFCFFDYLDYAAIIKATGRVDPDVIASHVPNAKSRMVLGWINHAFAISNREIAFLKRHCRSVSYSPVPILLGEYESSAPSPRAARGVREEDFVFVCLNRLSVIKGQDVALEAFLMAADRMPGARLVFVGNTKAEPAFTEAMEQRAAASGLGDRILFTGLVEREELLGWLQHSDIQVVPARFMNSGAVVVESWISGTPVLQSDAVDPNLVVEGVNGYGFPANDAAALARKMVVAFENHSRLKGMAAEGRKIVLERYTYEALTDLYLRTYDEVTRR